MQTRTLIFTIASVALFAACAQPPAPAAPDTSEADAATVRGLTDTFVAAWNKADKAAVGPMIAADVIEMPQGQDAIRGRDAVVEAMMAGFDATTVQQTATVEEVFMIGDYANAWGTWRIDPISAADEAAEITTGKWMALYRRNEAGGWEIWRWMWNQTGGPPVPAT